MTDSAPPRDDPDRQPLDRPSGTAVPLPLSEARRDVLYALKRRGDATVDEMADALAITVAGARQHLTALVDQGLVAAREDAATTRGRPRLRYRVTHAADGIFPKAYGELTNELLGYLDDPALEEALFDRRRDQRIAAAEARLAGLDLEGRVTELTRILDEDGYMAAWERLDDASFVIAEQNCAIAAVARAHPCACRSEIDFIRAVLPTAEVERTSHIVSGDVRCAYLITPRPG